MTSTDQMARLAAYAALCCMCMSLQGVSSSSCPAGQYLDSAIEECKDCHTLCRPNTDPCMKHSFMPITNCESLCGAEMVKLCVDKPETAATSDQQQRPPESYNDNLEDKHHALVVGLSVMAGMMAIAAGVVLALCWLKKKSNTGEINTNAGETNPLNDSNDPTDDSTDVTINSTGQVEPIEQLAANPTEETGFHTQPSNQNNYDGVLALLDHTGPYDADGKVRCGADTSKSEFSSDDDTSSSGECVASPVQNDSPPNYNNQTFVQNMP